MEILFNDRKGYRLTVNPNTKRVTVKCPEHAKTRDTDYAELIEFARTVAESVLANHDKTLRGKLYITSEVIRITMYNHDKSYSETFEQKRG